MQETPVRFLGWEGPLENGRATLSSILAWRIPWTEKLGRLQSMGMQRVGHLKPNLTQVWSQGQEDPLRKGMATHSNVLAWRIPWTEEPGGLQSMELQRVRHDWATNTHTHTHTQSLSKWLIQKYYVYLEVLRIACYQNDFFFLVSQEDFQKTDFLRPWTISNWKSIYVERTI